MKLWFSRFFRGAEGEPRAARRSYRPQLETLERREVASATSWFDSYRPALVSAPGQERRADAAAFAVGSDNTLTQIIGGLFAFKTGTYKGAVDHGYAQDICAGRDASGYAQCLVHGTGDHVLLYQARTASWTDLGYGAAMSVGRPLPSGGLVFAGPVWQISAGENGSMFVLDTKHVAWRYNGQVWLPLRDQVREIQAPRNFFDAGLYIRDDHFHVWHETSSGWELLARGFPEVEAHALSVNANGNVFILDQHGSVREYVRFGKFEEFGYWKPWWGYITTGAIAIDACTYRDGNRRGDLVYAAIRPDALSDFEGEVDWPLVLDTSGTGSGGDSPGWWFANKGNTRFNDTAIVTSEFSGASGTTTVYARGDYPGSTSWIFSIDWVSAYPHPITWICPML